MINGFRWVKHTVVSEATEMLWCEECQLWHMQGDCKAYMEPVEPNVMIKGLLTGGKSEEVDDQRPQAE